MVTGGFGFCGQYLSAALAKEKHQVFSLYLPGSKSQKPVHSRIKSIPLDITDSLAVFNTLKKIQPDIIFHLAAMSIPRKSWEDIGGTYRINISGTHHLLEGLRRLGLKSKFIFTSSVHVYGRAFEAISRVSEKTIPLPESPYAVSKLIAELLCLNYYERFHIPVVISRAFNHIGVGLSTDLVLSDWTHQIALAEKKGRESDLRVGNIHVKRQFLHVKDVVSAYLKLAQKGKAGQIYNIAAKRAAPLKSYLDFLCDQSRVPLDIKVEGARLRSHDVREMSGSAEKLMRLGWRPKHDVFDALEEMLNDWRQKV